MTRFYFASAYHLPGRPNGGSDPAAAVIRDIEQATGWECTSHWPADFRHGETWYARVAAETDLADIRAADVLIFAPTTPTSRGTHVELGYALAFGKRILGWRPPGVEGTAFDTLVEPLPEEIAALVSRRPSEAQEGS